MRGRWHSLAISIGAKISFQTQWPVSRPRFCYYFSLPETSPVRYEKWEIFSVLCSQLCDFVGVRPKPSSAQHRIIIHLSDFLIFPIAFALLFSVLNLKTHSLCFSVMFFCVFQHEKFVYFVIHQRLHNGRIDVMKAQTISWPFDLLDSRQLSSLMIFVHHEGKRKKMKLPRWQNCIILKWQSYLLLTIFIIAWIVNFEILRKEIFWHWAVLAFWIFNNISLRPSWRRDSSSHIKNLVRC